MKKITLLLVSFVIAGSVSAQFSEDFNFGPKGGFLTSSIITNEADFKEVVNESFQGGAFLRINLRRFYLQPELNYQTKGGVFEGTGSKVDIKRTILLSSLDVPLLFGYLLAGKDSPNLRIMAGPVASVPVKKEIRIEQNGITHEGDKENLNDVNYGLQAGAGVDLLFLTIDIRYEYGLSNVYNNDSSSKDLMYKNNLFNVSLGIKF